MKHAYSVFCLALAVAAAPLASAAGYMKLGDIKGESQAVRHEEWITIETMSEGYMRQGPTAGSARVRSNVVTEGISVTKPMDKSTPLLRKALVTGQRFQEVVIDMSTSGQASNVGLQVTLTNAVISKIESNLGGSPSTEEVTLNFEKIEWTYSDRTGATTEASYDFASGRP